MAIDYKAELEAMRRRFTRNPKDIKKLYRPPWMKNPTETLALVYDEIPKLYETGQVYYAGLVQANKLLFEWDKGNDCPANIVVGMDDHFSENPAELFTIGQTLYQYKAADPATVPSAIKRVVSSISTELERVYNFPIPLTNPDLHVFFTTIMAFRVFIPGWKVQGRIFPVVTAPGTLQSTIMLPKQYWTQAFSDAAWGGTKIK